MFKEQTAADADSEEIYSTSLVRCFSLAVMLCTLFERGLVRISVGVSRNCVCSSTEVPGYDLDSAATVSFYVTSN
jgi:hypothetical protein